MFQILLDAFSWHFNSFPFDGFIKNLGVFNGNNFQIICARDAITYLFVIRNLYINIK